ncbi:MAG: TauD/TfdA family dioxygenase, partial [Pseudomonadota bacterium]
MQIIPLTGGLGAEILGADVRRAEDFDAIHTAFAEYVVVVIRAQDETPDDHLAFARRFGPINVNRFFRPVDGYP